MTASGGTVHWCETPADARAVILTLCQAAGARTVTKSKSMIAEELELNPFLEEHGVEPVETDLGEYIVQLADERPSHIIAPAVHKTRDQVADLFHEKHTPLGRTRRLERVEELVEEAREVLRPRYLAADVGITGANFLIAETGSSAVVTNEGNADLTQILPRVHIVIATLEKMVPTLEDATTIMRVLARSATGQEFSTYTTVSTGPRRSDDADGPRGLSRGAARQRARKDARLRIQGGAAVYQVRGLHEPLPGVRCGGPAMPTVGSIPGRWAPS